MVGLLLGSELAFVGDYPGEFLLAMGAAFFLLLSVEVDEFNRCLIICCAFDCLVSSFSDRAIGGLCVFAKGIVSAIDCVSAKCGRIGR